MTPKRRAKDLHTSTRFTSTLGCLVEYGLKRDTLHARLHVRNALLVICVPAVEYQYIAADILSQRECARRACTMCNTALDSPVARYVLQRPRQPRCGHAIDHCPEDMLHRL